MNFSIALVLVCYIASSKANNRTKRFLVFPQNTATGVLAALAIPLDLPHRAVFVSYNFETNYNTPTRASDYTQGILQKFPSTQSPNSASPVRRSIEENENRITRKAIYKMIEDQVGRSCLLRAICDVAREPFSKFNGVTGDVMHVLFSPSSSKVEGLPDEFLEAERSGRRMKECSNFVRQCPYSLLDFFMTDE